MEVTFLTNRDEERIVADKLLFTEQSLTEEQQLQARTNIGAIGAGELPSALPNPHRLVFTGAVSAEYDGSEEVEVEIPEGGSGIPTPDKAEVGQTIVVKAVDENGKPTEWEAADLPSGGGAESKWELLTTVTLAEAVIDFTIKTTDAGIPFSEKNITELAAYLTIPEIPDITQSHNLVVLFNDWHPMYTNAASAGWLRSAKTTARLYLKATGTSAQIWFNSTLWTQNSTSSVHQCFNFTKLRLLNQTNVPIPAGTVIQVYGR